MAEQIIFNVDVDSGDSPKNLNELTSRVDQLKQKISQTDIGSKEFKQLSSELQKTSSQVKTLEKDLKVWILVRFQVPLPRLGEQLPVHLQLEVLQWQCSLMIMKKCKSL